MAKLKFSELSIGMQQNNRINYVPSIFLYIPGCNLCCIRNDGKTCNKVNTIGKAYTTEDAAEFINDNKHINHIVIKGGEPLMYKKELEQFLDSIWRDDLVITIYTNGTLPMLNPLAYNYRVALYVVDMSDKNIPTAGTTVRINNNDVVLGTNDIERMTQDNTKWLRELCMYSNDYLLLVHEANEIDFKNKADEVAKRISSCEDPFIDKFFETHPVKEHIVFVGSGWSDVHVNMTYQLCIDTGYKFSKLEVCGDKIAPM